MPKKTRKTRREKSEEKNGSGQRVKHSTPTLPKIDALIGKEEQNGKLKEEQKETGSMGHRGKSPTPTRAVDTLIGNEEQNCKTKKDDERREPGPRKMVKEGNHD